MLCGGREEGGSKIKVIKKTRRVSEQEIDSEYWSEGFRGCRTGREGEQRRGGKIKYRAADSGT